MMEKNKSKLRDFVGIARSIVGKNANEMFSLEDINCVAHMCGLDGVVYLEKFDDTRHVNVLLNFDKDCVILYDSLSGVKVKPYDKVQFGMYCEPVGAIREGFQQYMQQKGLKKSKNVWNKYEDRGRLLFEFLNQHEKFKFKYAKSFLTKNMPVLQDNRSSFDCAPISLFMMT